MTAILEGLYALTPDGADTDGLLAKVERALAGGVRLVQYRNKEADAAARRSQACALLALCRRYGARLIINDDWRLALEIDADGAHLGRDDGDPAQARAALGGKLLGISCYAEFERAQWAARLGADYVAFGAVFPSATKPQAVRAPLELLGRARRELGLPVAAIGGITLENAPLVLAAGAAMLAVISDLFAAPDIRARAEGYGRLFRR